MPFCTCFKDVKIVATWSLPAFYQVIQSDKSQRHLWCTCMCGCIKKKGLPRSECGMQPHSHISHFEHMKSVLCEHGYCNKYKLKSFNVKHISLAYLCLSILESKDHTYSAGSKEGFFCWQMEIWKLGLPFEVSCLGVCGSRNGHDFLYCPVSGPNPSPKEQQNLKNFFLFCGLWQPTKIKCTKWLL